VRCQERGVLPAPSCERCKWCGADGVLIGFCCASSFTRYDCERRFAWPQGSCPLVGRIAAIGISIPARVARFENVFEVLTVVRAGCVGLNLADELMLLVNFDRTLVSEVAVAVLLRLSGFEARVAALNECQVGGDRAPVGQLLLPSAFALHEGGHPLGFNNLRYSHDELLLR